MANTPKERPSTLSEEEVEVLRQEGKRLEARRRRLEQWYAPHLAHIQAKSERYYLAVERRQLAQLPWWKRLLVKLGLIEVPEPTEWPPYTEDM